MTDKQIIEHELLYEGLDWSVGVDGMFINPKQIPYTNCLYELALACDSKSKQLKRKEQECEELKEINSTLLEYRRHAVTCQDCYEDGLEDGKTSNKELRKLKQTLENIAKGKIDKYSCAEEYASEKLKEISNG